MFSNLRTQQERDSMRWKLLYSLWSRFVATMSFISYLQNKGYALQNERKGVFRI